MHTSRLSQKHANTSYERPIERPTSMAVALANGMAWPWPWPLRESHWTHWPSNASPLVAHWAPIERPLIAHCTLIYLALIVIANAHWIEHPLSVQCRLSFFVHCLLPRVNLQGSVCFGVALTWANIPNHLASGVLNGALHYSWNPCWDFHRTYSCFIVTYSWLCRHTPMCQKYAEGESQIQPKAALGRKAPCIAVFVVYCIWF